MNRWNSVSVSLSLFLSVRGRGGREGQMGERERERERERSDPISYGLVPPWAYVKVQTHDRVNYSARL